MKEEGNIVFIIYHTLRNFLCLAHLPGCCSAFMYSPMFMCRTGTDLEKPLVCLSVLDNDNSHLGIFWKGGFLTEDLQRQEV